MSPFSYFFHCSWSSSFKRKFFKGKCWILGRSVPLKQRRVCGHHVHVPLPSRAPAAGYLAASLLCLWILPALRFRPSFPRTTSSPRLNTSGVPEPYHSCLTWSSSMPGLTLTQKCMWSELFFLDPAFPLPWVSDLYLCLRALPTCSCSLYLS